MNAGDTAFALFSSGMVMLITPGLALFYGGMVRARNVLGTILQSFILIGVISLQWLLWGCSMLLRLLIAIGITLIKESKAVHHGVG